MAAEVPPIDIAALRDGTKEQRLAVGRSLDEACQSIGFFSVVGHGVDAALMERMQAVTRGFFALPLDARASCAPGQGQKGTRGYRGVGQESLARSLGETMGQDLRETFRIGNPRPGDDAYARAGRDSYYAPNIWPIQPPDFRETWEAYYAAMEDLSGRIMRGFALGLDLPEGFFEPKIDRHISHLQSNFYTPQDEAPADNQWRAGAHTDYGSLTILWQEPGVAGLQVRNTGGAWVDIEPDERAFVVNVGDLMAYWTNDRWVSTLHRVANPPRERADKTRLSISFFHQPNADAVVECLPTCVTADNPARYPATTSGAHLMGKIRKANAEPVEAPAAVGSH